MAGAPSQQQPMLSGVQMAQAGQPGKVTRTGLVTDLEQECENKLGYLPHFPLTPSPELETFSFSPLGCDPAKNS